MQAHLLNTTSSQGDFSVHHLLIREMRKQAEWNMWSQVCFFFLFGVRVYLQDPIHYWWLSIIAYLTAFFHCLYFVQQIVKKCDIFRPLNHCTAFPLLRSLKLHFLTSETSRQRTILLVINIIIRSMDSHQHTPQRAWDNWHTEGGGSSQLTGYSVQLLVEKHHRH